MSIALPYACIDHVQHTPSRYRQLNADVLSAFIERMSSAPYRSTRCILGTRNPTSNSLRNTRTMSSANQRWTTSLPHTRSRLKSQCVNRTSRRSRSATGHPARQEDPTIRSRTLSGIVETVARKFSARACATCAAGPAIVEQSMTTTTNEARRTRPSCRIRIRIRTPGRVRSARPLIAVVALLPIRRAREPMAEARALAADRRADGLGLLVAALDGFLDGFLGGFLGGSEIRLRPREAVFGDVRAFDRVCELGAQSRNLRAISGRGPVVAVRGRHLCVRRFGFLIRAAGAELRLLQLLLETASPRLRGLNGERRFGGAAFRIFGSFHRGRDAAFGVFGARASILERGTELVHLVRELPFELADARVGLGDVPLHLGALVVERRGDG